MDEKYQPSIYDSREKSRQEDGLIEGEEHPAHAFFYKSLRRSRIRSILLLAGLLACVAMVLVLLYRHTAPQPRADGRARAPGGTASVPEGPVYIDFDTERMALPMRDEHDEPLPGALTPLEKGAPLHTQWLKQAAYHVAEAERARRENAFETALEHYEDALRIFPGLRGVHAYRGLLFLRLDQPAAAAEAFARALAENPDHAGAANNLGLSYMMLGRTDQAVAAFEQAIRSDPTYAIAHFNRALLHNDQGQSAQAERHLRAYLDMRPGDMQAAQFYVRMLIDRENWSEAADWLDIIRRYAPASAGVYFRMAQVLGHAGHTDKALFFLREGAGLTDPRLALSWMSRTELDPLRAHPEFRRLLVELTPAD